MTIVILMTYDSQPTLTTLPHSPRLLTCEAFDATAPIFSRNKSPCRSASFETAGAKAKRPSVKAQPGQRDLRW